MEISEFFAGRAPSKLIFDQVLSAANSLGSVEVRVTKSQIALARNKPFAWAWVPEMHLGRKAAPLVLTFSFTEPRSRPHWKEIYQAAPGRFTHHMELWSPEDVDEEVRVLLQEAWDTVASERRAPARPRSGNTVT